MPFGRVLLALAVWGLAAGAVMAGPVGMIAHDPVSDAFFDVSVNLIPSGPPIVPPNPTHDMTDPTRPVFTQDVFNQALLTFAMTGRNGETFMFDPVPLPPPPDIPLSLTMQFAATGNMGSFFDLFFDASYLLEGSQHAPVLGKLVSIPTEPCEVLYTLRFEDDPPFSVEIFMLNPEGGNTNPATFALAPVPEPATMIVCLLAAATLAGSRCRRRT